MKRLHVHVAVDDLAASIKFYSTMFAAEPTVTKDDYAKWMLDDPRVNFAISARGAPAGLNHLGVQVENADELAEMNTRLQKLDGEVVEEMGTACCYAKSDKYWATDPTGIDHTASGNACTGSSPGNSSTGWASIHQPPARRGDSATSAKRGGCPGKAQARRRRRTASAPASSNHSAKRVPSASRAASGNPGRRRPPTPSQRPNARLAPRMRPSAPDQAIGVASASRGSVSTIAPI